MCNKIKWYEDNFLKKDTTILEKDPTKTKKRKAPCGRCSYGIRIKYNYEEFFGPAFRCQIFEYPDKEQWCDSFKKQPKEILLNYVLKISIT